MSKKIKFHESNLNKGTEFGDMLLEKSIEKFGFREAGVIDKNGKIVSGNHRVQKSSEKGIDEIQIIKGDPNKIIMVQYDDIDLDTENGKELAFALNQTAKKNIEIDTKLAIEELGEEIFSEWGGEKFNSRMLNNSNYHTKDGDGDADDIENDLFPITILQTKEEYEDFLEIKRKLNTNSSIIAFSLIIKILKNNDKIIY